MASSDQPSHILTLPPKVDSHHDVEPSPNMSPPTRHTSPEEVQPTNPHWTRAQRGILRPKERNDKVKFHGPTPCGFLLGNGKIRVLREPFDQEVLWTKGLLLQREGRPGVRTMVEADAAGASSWELWFDLTVLLSNVKQMLFSSLSEGWDDMNSELVHSIISIQYPGTITIYT
ncbi:hypothetical protein NE237_026387 [Protea cynaroides]|uniref:Uncharacterized protein n=1 Tax=Protea cynaroides TaxID=273540 RepID=A0A9Q0H622_9MAGN|nr:hypothetical protein NE237_026387 [Protea cynaroides]